MKTSGEKKYHPAKYGTDGNEVCFFDALFKNQGGKNNHPDWGGVLQKDGIGCSG